LLCAAPDREPLFAATRPFANSNAAASKLVVVHDFLSELKHYKIG